MHQNLKLKEPVVGWVYPRPDEVATSLNAPEIAPAVAATDVHRYSRRTYRQCTMILWVQNSDRGIYPPRWPFCQKNKQDAGICNTCHPAFDQKSGISAEREGLKLVEVLEKAVEAYKEKQDTNPECSNLAAFFYTVGNLAARFMLAKC